MDAGLNWSRSNFNSTEAPSLWKAPMLFTQFGLSILFFHFIISNGGNFCDRMHSPISTECGDSE